MGTSAPYDAPPSWEHVKSDVTRLAKEGNIPAAKLRRLVQKMVHANGGKTEMSRGGGQGASGGAGSAVPARATAGRLASFISDVQQFGLAEAAKRSGLGDLSGMSVSEVLNTLLDRLGGESSTVDDADARQAFSDLQEELLADAKTVEEVGTILSDPELNVEGLLERYFGHYVFEQFSRVFYERLVQRVGAQQALSFLSQIKEFIRSSLAGRALERDLSKVDWGGTEGANMVNDICAQTLEVFGA